MNFGDWIGVKALYSKASNNAASYSADLATTWFLIGSKITWSQRFLGKNLTTTRFFFHFLENPHFGRTTCTIFWHVRCPQGPYTTHWLSFNWFDLSMNLTKIVILESWRPLSRHPAPTAQRERTPTLSLQVKMTMCWRIAYIVLTLITCYMQYIY